MFYFCFHYTLCVVIDQPWVRCWYGLTVFYLSSCVQHSCSLVLMFAVLRDLTCRGGVIAVMLLLSSWLVSRQDISSVV
ncbi:hypothetical protein BDV32DRAFT_72681 [Aspergillus pseudonomiae]|nr:hypothetical protein BDV32DRAFT_72681 [Aspergillus pseudonomiae]